jgi:signal transduction histidine kinase
MPGIYLCISDGNALLSSQCQHLHWASQVKHRLFDDRMNPAFKTFLNDPKFMWDAKAQESDLFNQIVSAYKKNTSSAAVGAGFSDWLHATDLQGGEDTARYLSYVKYKVVEGQYVELSLRPWTYGRDIEMAALYSFALLLAYVLVQMATYDCGCFMPCSKRNKKPRRMGFMFFVSLNLYSFSWAILYHISIPWSTATEIFFRPILYWFCFIIFVYIIERTRREAWSRSEEIRRHLRDKSRLHQHYLEQQNQFVADLAHNYGNMSSTIAVCWTDVADAHAYVLMQDDKPSKEALAAVNESILKAKALSEMTQTVVMASVRTLRGHFQCKASRVDLFDTIKWIPYLTSNYKRYKVEIKENVPQNIMVDYAVLLTSLSNFASNAQKYSSGEILIIASYLDGVVRLEVIDRGGGVPRDKQAVIFERGEQSRLQKGKMGQGIGLHSVATIVSKSVGGRLGIISPFFKDADSPGSCFWFELIDQGYGSIESKAGVAPTMHSSFTSFGERCIGEKPKTGGPAVQILLVEDNLLMQLAIKTKLGRYFQSMSIGCNFTCIPADKPDTMGEMALACLKSPTAMFDVVFLDQQLGVRQEGSSCLWGTDVIQKYAQWLEQSGGTKAEDLGDWRYEDQIIHILSAAGSGADILKNAGVEETYPWLQPCPFSKPIQERELQQFNVMEYPHFRRRALEAMSAPDAQDETSEGMVELMETKETKEKAEGGAFENRKILTRKEGKQVVQSKRDDG